EGVQEFFLVVSRPKGMTLDDFCVDALLYTAHLDSEAARNAIMEPKTMEMQWIDIWATAPRLLHPDGVPKSFLRFLVPIPIPTVNDPATLISKTVKEFQDEARNLGHIFFNQMLADPLQPDSGYLQVRVPAIFDQVFPSTIFPTDRIVAPPGSPI